MIDRQTFFDGVICNLVEYRFLQTVASNRKTQYSTLVRVDLFYSIGMQYGSLVIPPNYVRNQYFPKKGTSVLYCRMEESVAL